MIDKEWKDDLERRARRHVFRSNATTGHDRLKDGEIQWYTKRTIKIRGEDRYAGVMRVGDKYVVLCAPVDRIDDKSTYLYLKNP
jgi:hypothetical protein